MNIQMQPFCTIFLHIIAVGASLNLRSFKQQESVHSLVNANDEKTSQLNREY